MQLRAQIGCTPPPVFAPCKGCDLIPKHHKPEEMSYYAECAESICLLVFMTKLRPANRMTSNVESSTGVFRFCVLHDMTSRLRSSFDITRRMILINTLLSPKTFNGLRVIRSQQTTVTRQNCHISCRRN